jgi:PAS domain S-box-containing protein
MTGTTRILIIEDDQHVRAATARVLKTAGYDVIEAATGNGGLAMAKSHRPDLVLLDVILPDLNGLDVCRQIKSNPLLSRIMVIQTSSTEVSSERQSLGLEFGADGYIARPVSNRELVARVHAMLRIKKAETAVAMSEERFRCLTLATAQIVWTTNPKGEVTGDLPSWCLFTGQKPENVRGWGWLDAIHPDDLAGATQAWRQSLDSANPYDAECRLLHRDGSYRYVSIRAVAICEQDGSVREWMGACADITDRKTVEAERERLLAELRETLAEVKTLKGFIPICASCKKIRDDKGFWDQLESYISRHSDATFTHGICPECATRMYPKAISHGLPQPPDPPSADKP